MDAALDFNHREKPPAFVDEVNTLIDRALIAEHGTRLQRDYLGGSRLGESCSRRLQYEYLKAPKDEGAEFSGQSLRIFALGHVLEDLAIEWLRKAGFELRVRNRQGEQFGFEAAGGRVQGHADGVLVAAPIGVAVPALWECKSANAKNWRDIVKRGVSAAKPIYAAQIALYQAYLGLTENPALFTAINKDTCELWHELVPFDGALAQATSDKAVQILRACDAGELLPRHTADPEHFECRFCPLESEVLGMIPDADPDREAPTVQPDPAMIALYADVVFGYCERWVPVRALAEKGAADAPPHTPFLEADGELASRLALQALWAADAGMALFVVPGTVESPGEARAENVTQTQVVLVDLDHGDISAKREHLLRHLGTPTLEVASGGVAADGQRKLHLYWRLTEPAEGEDIARVCRARHMIATKVGGDPAFRSAHQPIRVAGSVHAKSGTRRLVKVLHHDPRDHDLGELIEAIVAMPPLEGEAVSDLDFNDASVASGSVTELFGRKVREGGLDGTTRFDALSRVIGYWIRRCREGHVTPAQGWDEIVGYNAARIDPPWPEARLAQEAERLWKRDAERNGDLPCGGDGDGDVPSGGGGDDDGPVPVRFTEDALAATFAERHAETWRYVAAWGQWLVWSGIAWRREDTLQAYDFARRVCREAAARAGTPKLKAKLSSAATVSAVERLARSDRRHASTTEVWDRDPWLLNTPKGVVDLRTGALAAHDPLLHMTKTAGASAIGNCPVWMAFLDTVTRGDADLQAYLQRMAGYCLTGITSEHALFFLYGTGANGKSVFANTLTAILGDYATVAAMDMFMATHGERHPTDMAGLRGARIVTSIETEQGSRWAESKLKALTGGDKITARFMRQDFFEFTPQFKLLIVGNHKPSIRNVDEAMKRRLHMVPFTVTIPAPKRDKRLPDRLLAERDGILAWALEGCLEWQRTGLRPPAAVMAATEDYFEAEDAVGRWIDERCVKGPQHSEGSTALYTSWKSWAEANGEYAGSMKRFSETLSNRGFPKRNTAQARGFRGIGLKDSNSELFAED